MEKEKIEETPVVEEQVEEVASEEEVVATEEVQEEVQEEVATEEVEEEAPAAEEVTETIEETADNDAVENFEVEETEEVEVEEEVNEPNEEEIVEESIEDKQATYEALTQKIADLEAEVASYQAQVKELIAYKNDAEKAKKTSLINKYSILLGEDACKNYTANIENYTFEELKKEVSVAVLECNEEALFNKDESKEVVINVDVTKNYSGAARLMSKYYKD